MFSERKGIRYRRKRKKRIAVMTITAVCLVLIGGLIWGLSKRKTSEVILKVKNVSMLQDEKIPPMQVKASSKGEKVQKKKLEKGYTVGDLLKDLNAGKGYHLKYEIDQTKEGKYPIQISFEKELKKKLEKTWKRKLTVRVENGICQVKNKYGTWEENKFKKWDNSYAESEFVHSKGNTYYIDENGEKVSGWKDIDHFRYFFRQERCNEYWLERNKRRDFLFSGRWEDVCWLEQNRRRTLIILIKTERC